MRNNQTQRFSQKQAQRLHQGLVTSTTEQVVFLPAVFIPPLLTSRIAFVLDCDALPVSKVMERLCVRVQQQVCVLRGIGEVEELQAAKQVLKEARNSRAVSGREISERLLLFFTLKFKFFFLSLKLYPSLCELAHVLSVDGPMRQRLDSLSGEVAKAADKELQVDSEGLDSLVTSR